jgi:two-component system cell cycle response regulator DivK
VTSPPPGAPTRGPGDAEGLLVLIVDDNEKNLRLARDVLLAAGLRTLDAANATEGIELAGKHLPDVILMDIQLPDMNGTEAVRKLGDTPRTAQIPVVALTSLRLDGADDWFINAGFAGYLEKPINIREFPHQVRRWASGENQAPASL